VVFGAAFEFVQLRLKGSLLPLVFAHLPQDGILLKSLRVVAVLADVFAVYGQEGGCDRGANLDVIFPRQVSVWVRAGAVDGQSLPLCGRSRVVGTRPLSVLHLDSVK